MEKKVAENEFVKESRHETTCSFVDHYAFEKRKIFGVSRNKNCKRHRDDASILTVLKSSFVFHIHNTLKPKKELINPRKGLKN